VEGDKGVDNSGNSINLLSDQLLYEAVSACNNMQAEITKLTKIIQQQQNTISSMDAKLVKVLSILQSSSAARLHQVSSINQNNGGATSSASASAAASAASSSGSGSRSGPRQQSTTSSGNGNQIRNQNGRRADRQGADDQVAADEFNGDNDGFTLIIHRTLNDVARRKRNIVITGLEEEETSGKTDQQTFEQFCELFMPFKPSLAHDNCCRRIGKSIDGKPRRLLVKLHSEEAAAAVLEVAPSLRHCLNSYVSSNVFINADLSPSAAKLAFEARKRRRDNRKGRSAAAAATTGGDAVAAAMDDTTSSDTPSQHSGGVLAADADQSTVTADGSRRLPPQRDAT